MRKKISGISLIVLSLLTACISPVTNLEVKDLSINTNKIVKTAIMGKADFPESPNPLYKGGLVGLNTKATLAEVGVNATVSVIYPSEHVTLANKTIATGLTDTNGNFVINPNANFNPSQNEVFVLEATKRIGNTGTSLMSVRTFIKWNGTAWDSITTPSLNINSKTTALTAMIGLLAPNVTASDAIGTITVSGNTSTTSDISHLGTIITHANTINSVAELVDYTLLNNLDPFQYLIYENSAFSLKEPSYVRDFITTTAGNNLEGYNGDNIQASNAQLNFPSGIVFDSLDNLYIADKNNNRIRKIDKASGIITTVAGTGIAGYNGDNILASTAQISYPLGASFDSIGNMYISDNGNNRIRKIDKNTGLISTISNGSNTGVYIDSLDNIYFSDFGGNRVYKIDKVTGNKNSIAGNGTSGYHLDEISATSANLYYPWFLATDNKNNLYIANSITSRISRVNLVTGFIYNFAGNGAGYNGENIDVLNANLGGLFGMTFDSQGNLYISTGHRIRKITLGKKVTI